MTCEQCGLSNPYSWLGSPHYCRVRHPVPISDPPIVDWEAWMMYYPGYYD